MRNSRIILIVVCVLGLAISTAVADWDPGDDHKMHFPQMPNPQEGWDVWGELADDWQCSETGPVTDIHMWYSWEDDVVGAPAVVAVTIYSDDANPGAFSRPDLVLWERDFPIQAVTSRWYGAGVQGWFDPAGGLYREVDHDNYYQLNIVDIIDPFVQQAGTLYWLGILLVDDQAAPVSAGWKTSLDHFNDDAVWYDFGAGEWQELFHPLSGTSMDLAFVITPEPATMSLLALGGLALLRRRSKIR